MSSRAMNSKTGMSFISSALSPAFPCLLDMFDGINTTHKIGGCDYNVRGNQKSFSLYLILEPFTQGRHKVYRLVRQ